MSSDSIPITTARFAAALAELPISALYAKYAELSNSITHLESSNKQLEDFARENDDRDCYEALLENRQVMKNFNERMDLIRKEVEEVRSLPWRPRDEVEVRTEEGAIELNGAAPTQNGTNGSTPAEPQARSEQTNSTPAQAREDEEEGVHLSGSRTPKYDNARLHQLEDEGPSHVYSISCMENKACVHQAPSSRL